MKQEQFDLVEFRNHLEQLEKELAAGVKKDENYQGEIDGILGSLKRLTKELKDDKYQQILPDLFAVLEFLDMVENVFEEEEEELEDLEEDED